MKTFTMAMAEFNKQSHVTERGVLYVDIGTRGDCDASLDFTEENGIYSLSAIVTRIPESASHVSHFKKGGPGFDDFRVVTPFGTINTIPAHYVEKLKTSIDSRY